MNVQRAQAEEVASNRMPNEQPQTENGAAHVGTTDESESSAHEQLDTMPDEAERAVQPEIVGRRSGTDQVVPTFIQDLLNASIEHPRELVPVIVEWLGPDASRSLFADKKALDLFLTRLIATIDRRLREQVNAILHHPEFQTLESCWRGLDYLVQQMNRDESERIKLRVLNLSWRDLRRDMQLANEFDQSELFRKVYEDEFGTAGGEPFGLLIGDYQIRRTNDDLEVLEHVSGVAQASFAPFIASAAPSLIGLDRFDELQRVRDIGDLASDAATATWFRLRSHDHARFVGLTLPRMLIRLPYRDDGSRHDGFRFWEETSEMSEFLWGNVAWAFGAVVMRAFDRTGWLADIRGVKRGHEVAGLVPGIEPDAFQTDLAEPAVLKPVTDVMITDRHEKQLSELGFVPLTHLRESGRAAFYSTLSLYQPKQFTDDRASASERLSSMLQYTLCASRFAHYLKMMMRDRTGSYEEPETLQDELNRWLSNFVRDDEDASSEVMARYPLREGNVRIWRGEPGKFASEIHLRPHYQLDALAATVRLQTEMREG